MASKALGLVPATSLAARATLSANGFRLDSPLFYFTCTSISLALRRAAA